MKWWGSELEAGTRSARLLRKRPLYSVCLEDTRTEIRALEPTSDDLVVCIAAGGGRALSLLSASSGRMIAIDTRPDQLYNLELKSAAVDALAYDDFRSFIGLDPGGDREGGYLALRPLLSPGAKRYWDRRTDLIREGVLYAGRLEQGLSLVSRRLRAIGLLSWPEQLLYIDELDEQRALLAANPRALSFLRWYWRIFCTPLVAWLGVQDPGFLRSTEGALGRYLFECFTEFSKRRLLHDSLVLHILYFGSYQTERVLPIYLTRVGFDAVKKRLGRLELRCLRVEEAARRLAISGPSKWSLSDISSWMSERKFCAFLSDFTSQLRPGDRFCYRNFGAIRRIPPQLGTRIERLSSLIEEVEEQDTSVFFRTEIGEVRREGSDRASEAREANACG